MFLLFFIDVREPHNSAVLLLLLLSPPPLRLLLLLPLHNSQVTHSGRTKKKKQEEKKHRNYRRNERYGRVEKDAADKRNKRDKTKTVCFYKNQKARYGRTKNGWLTELKKSRYIFARSPSTHIRFGSDCSERYMGTVAIIKTVLLGIRSEIKLVQEKINAK